MFTALVPERERERQEQEGWVNCDGKCVKGQLLWYERGPELMQ